MAIDNKTTGSCSLFNAFEYVRYDEGYGSGIGFGEGYYDGSDFGKGYGYGREQGKGYGW